MMRPCLILLVMLSATAQAQSLETVPDGLGNLPPGFYPAPSCPKPVLEEDEGERNLANVQQTRLAVDSYHRKIDKYNRGVIAFNECAKTYIQKSRYDIENILSTVNIVVAEVRGIAPPPPPSAPGNLPADFYPRSACLKPDQKSLGAQPAATDLSAMRAYNLKAAAYNQQVVTFNSCLKGYQDKAQHDIQAIRAAVQPAAAPAQPSRRTGALSPAPESQSAALPVESVTVTGASSEAVNHFVQAVATPTHIIGKVARWEMPICPSALGLTEDALAKVVQRVREVAAQAGARVSSDASCKPNIVIAFTSTPQELLDNIRKDHVDWLGYHDGGAELDRLGTVTRPVEAWYSTATVDLNGRRQIDTSQISGRGLVITGPCGLIGGSGGRALPRGGMDLNSICTVTLPNAIKAEVKGSRLMDGLRAAFDHVTIIADLLAADKDMAAIDDYIAVIALAQVNSLETCQALPSITSLLVRGCSQAATEITANDMGFLKAVYAANPEKLPELQKNEIAYRMEQGIAGR